MTSEPRDTSSAGQGGSDDRRSAYEIAVQLLIYESELAWSRFNVLLVANTIIIPGIGLFWLNRQPVFALLLSILGTAVCVLLGITITRGLDFLAYWEASASQLEPDGPQKLQVIGRSMRFRDGESFLFLGRSKPLRLGWRHVRARGVTIVLISLFILIYALLFIASLASIVG